MAAAHELRLRLAEMRLAAPSAVLEHALSASHVAFQFGETSLVPDEGTKPADRQKAYNAHIAKLINAMQADLA